MGPVKNAIAKDDFSASISTPGPFSGINHRSLPLQDGKHFHVVIANKSTGTIKVWEAWNSWGFRNLRFEILDSDDNVVHSITKTTHKVWTVNSPSQTAIKSGQFFVCDVDLTNRDWVVCRDDKTCQTFPQFLEMRNERTLRLRAVYEIPKDDKSQQLSTWTGVVRTKPETFRFQPAK